MSKEKRKRDEWAISQEDQDTLLGIGAILFITIGLMVGCFFVTVFPVLAEILAFIVLFGVGCVTSILWAWCIKTLRTRWLKNKNFFFEE